MRSRSVWLALSWFLSLSLLSSACGDASGSGSMASGLTRFDSNGERIYFAGRNAAGERIRPSGGSPSSGMMMSNSLSCADCHGADARGGLHIMHMQVMQAPDIRWSTLSSGEHGEHGEDERTGEGHAETAYDKEAFMRAVRQGLEPDGHYLSSDMPRWEMSDADLMDLISYLKTLP